MVGGGAVPGGKREPPFPGLSLSLSLQQQKKQEEEEEEEEEGDIDLAPQVPAPGLPHLLTLHKFGIPPKTNTKTWRPEFADARAHRDALGVFRFMGQARLLPVTGKSRTECAFEPARRTHSEPQTKTLGLAPGP